MAISLGDGESNSSMHLTGRRATYRLLRVRPGLRRSRDAARFTPSVRPDARRQRWAYALGARPAPQCPDFPLIGVLGRIRTVPPYLVPACSPSTARSQSASIDNSFRVRQGGDGNGGRATWVSSEINRPSQSRTFRISLFTTESVSVTLLALD